MRNTNEEEGIVTEGKMCQETSGPENDFCLNTESALSMDCMIACQIQSAFCFRGFHIGVFNQHRFKLFRKEVASVLKCSDCPSPPSFPRQCNKMVLQNVIGKMELRDNLISVHKDKDLQI